jgi:hypothetical protein
MTKGIELGIPDVCPNCKETDPVMKIKPMDDGSCGVCGGLGLIFWKEVGKLSDFNETHG